MNWVPLYCSNWTHKLVLCCRRIEPCRLANVLGSLTTLVKLDLPEYTLDGGRVFLKARVSWQSFIAAQCPSAPADKVLHCMATARTAWCHKTTYNWVTSKHGATLTLCLCSTQQHILWGALLEDYANAADSATTSPRVLPTEVGGRAISRLTNLRAICISGDNYYSMEAADGQWLSGLGRLSALTSAAFSGFVDVSVTHSFSCSRVVSHSQNAATHPTPRMLQLGSSHGHLSVLTSAAFDSGFVDASLSSQLSIHKLSEYDNIERSRESASCQGSGSRHSMAVAADSGCGAWVASVH